MKRQLIVLFAMWAIAATLIIRERRFVDPHAKTKSNSEKKPQEQAQTQPGSEATPQPQTEYQTESLYDLFPYHTTRKPIKVITVLVPERVVNGSVICEEHTACAWSFYHPKARYLSNENVTNKYCICNENEICQESYDDSNINALVFRCGFPKT